MKYSKTMKEINWDNVKVGTEFIARMTGAFRKDIKGKIQKNGATIYLCQNYYDGGHSVETFGYKYAWSIEKGDKASIHRHSVKSLVLLNQTYEIF